MRWPFTLFMLFLISCHNKQDGFSLLSNQTKSKIYIQPFNDLSPDYTSYLVSRLRKLHPDITVLKPIALPKEAWYEPRKRYRADSLINYLQKRVNDGEIIVGLTSKDISTTKNNMNDWGIMGLGFTPGKSCVASTFRLNKQKSKQQFLKIVIHELGHTEGLNHCPVETCYMRDAEGGNPTDDETGFCDDCKKYLAKKGWHL